MEKIISAGVVHDLPEDLKTTLLLAGLPTQGYSTEIMIHCFKSID